MNSSGRKSSFKFTARRNLKKNGVWFKKVQIVYALTLRRARQLCFFFVQILPELKNRYVSKNVKCAFVEEN